MVVTLLYYCFGVRQAWVQTPAVLFPGVMTLCKLLNFSEPQFPHLLLWILHDHRPKMSSPVKIKMVPHHPVWNEKFLFFFFSPLVFFPLLQCFSVDTAEISTCYMQVIGAFRESACIVLSGTFYWDLDLRSSHRMLELGRVWSVFRLKSPRLIDISKDTKKVGWNGI